MAEHKLSPDVYEQIRSRRQALIVKRPAPAPGKQLRKAVSAALGTSTADPSPLAIRHIDDVLVGGLAWAAATDDTCRIEPAVRAVRVARVRLRAGDFDGARTALLAALDGLDRREAK